MLIAHTYLGMGPATEKRSDLTNDDEKVGFDLIVVLAQGLGFLASANFVEPAYQIVKLLRVIQQLANVDDAFPVARDHSG